MSNPSASRTSTPKADTPIKILVIEDEAIVAEDISQRLRRMGYQTIGPVNAGEDGMLLAEQARPDLVLMDIVLKGRIDGVEAAEMISQRLGLPVVFLTAHGDPATFARARQTVPRGYLLKPFSEADLHRSIELALGQHREARRIEGARRRLSDTLRAIHEGIVATDAEGRVSFINQAAEGLLGHALSDASGRPAEEIISLLHLERDEPVPSSLREALEKRTAVSPANPVRVRSSFGAVAIVQESATPICNDEEQVIGGIIVLRALPVQRNATDPQGELIKALLAAPDRIAEDRTLLPVCAWCKRIHADDGSWRTIEELLNEVLRVRMTHGICPSCSREIASSI